MREEEKARDERAKAQAERDEVAKQKALEKAREDLAASVATEV